MLINWVLPQLLKWFLLLICAATAIVAYKDLHTGHGR